MTDILTFEFNKNVIYGYQQLVNDFMHIKLVHIDQQQQKTEKENKNHINLEKAKIALNRYEFLYNKNIIKYSNLSKILHWTKHQKDYNGITLNDLQRVYFSTKQYTKWLCERYSFLFPCNDLTICEGYNRHYRERTNDGQENLLYFTRRNDNSKSSQMMNNKDIIFQQECDKVFFYKYIV